MPPLSLLPLLPLLPLMPLLLPLLPLHVFSRALEAVRRSQYLRCFSVLHERHPSSRILHLLQPYTTCLPGLAGPGWFPTSRSSSLCEEAAG